MFRAERQHKYCPMCRYYFFETSETPLYHIFYVAYSLGVFAVTTVYLAKGFLFVSMCCYLVAMYDDLKLMLQQIDVHPFAGKRVRQMIRCVDAHNQIYKWETRWETAWM